ncbi:Endoplasmic reticulum-Golgi intermediate compartment protein 3 [Mortierella sp. GBA35]|nr:Endoplasmic reticulum-Golgi intermediate compartment protein 3 [Mortierella sp. AD031]KAF9108039.1 Endoplasmic reticulum-Golgi intermediate compartment protein 3 [Mortierella sp. GBA35]KAG0214429.1 Endoplasmic reticulum-Golgi intermediate compartment protein 3 [Mortierella sp. NVP41]
MVKSTLSRFKNFDAYAKTLDDFRVKTSTGAAVTLVSAIIIAVLLLGEFFDYRSIHVESSLIVDGGRKAKMAIDFDISFPKIPCYILTLDVMDVAGDHQSDISHSVYKVQLTPDGQEVKRERAANLGDTGPDPKEVGENYCGSCAGAMTPPSGCCNTCEEVREAYVRSGWSFNRPEDIEQCVREGYMEKMKEQANQGCRVHGQLTVNKVAGNFHIAPGRSFQRGSMHVHDIRQYLEHGLDFSHHIKHLSFGEKVPNVHNPLDDQRVGEAEGLHMFQYYVKVVGTKYYYLNRAPVNTNQYSVTQFNRNLHQKDAMGMVMQPDGLPGVFFNFDISPMMVIQREERKSFTSFLTGVCAIVGGIFTVASIIDGAIWRAERTLKRKMELGKAL